jgi:alpha-1,2-mannosyltransferase
MPLPPPKAFLRLHPAADVHWARLAIGLWCAIIIAVASYSIVVVAKGTPDRISHSVSPVYWKAAHQWWQSIEMYGSTEPTQEGRHGFLYLPQAATLFTPLAYLPLMLAEVLWRVINISGVAWALWRVCGVFGGERRRLWFGLGTLLALSPTLLSSQNGQCNLLILAIMALGTVEMIERRWWRAAAWLALGLAFKPHVLVLILLVGVLQPPMRLRLLVALAVVAALPWLNPDWSYVWEEHISFVRKMGVAGKPPAGTEQDLVSLLYTFGITLPDRAWLVIRLAGAALVSLLSLLATLRFERAVALFYTFSFAILYIMIFNPRTEGPTHAMMAITLAMFTLAELTSRPRLFVWALASVCILLGASHNLIHPTNRWMQPMLELWFAVYLTFNVIARRPVLHACAEAGPQPAARAALAANADELVGNKR